MCKTLLVIWDLNHRAVEKHLELACGLVWKSVDGNSSGTECLLLQFTETYGKLGQVRFVSTHCTSHGKPPSPTSVVHACSFCDWTSFALISVLLPNLHVLGVHSVCVYLSILIIL